MTPDAYIEHVLAQCRELVSAGFWPDASDTRPDLWIENFAREDDRVIAAIILHRFVVFSEKTVVPLLHRSFFRLLQSIAPDEHDVARRRDKMELFLEEVAYCPIQGEDPNPTDSGYAMCRRFRKALHIEDKRFLEPQDALAASLTGAPVVFVDDFVGTGNQLRSTWTREYASTGPKTFESAHAAQPTEKKVLCLGITPEGKAVAELHGLQPCFAHYLTQRDSIQEIKVRPEHPIKVKLGERIDAFLRRHATQLNLKPYMKKRDHALYGFGEFGLTIAFPDSVPDASLPITWAPGLSTDWTPLKEQA